MWSKAVNRSLFFSVLFCCLCRHRPIPGTALPLCVGRMLKWHDVLLNLCLSPPGPPAGRPALRCSRFTGSLTAQVRLLTNVFHVRFGVYALGCGPVLGPVDQDVAGDLPGFSCMLFLACPAGFLRIRKEPGNNPNSRISVVPSCCLPPLRNGSRHPVSNRLFRSLTIPAPPIPLSRFKRIPSRHRPQETRRQDGFAAFPFPVGSLFIPKHNNAGFPPRARRRVRTTNR